MSDYIDPDSNKGLKLAKRSAGRRLAHLENIPQEAFVNALYEDMLKIKRIFVWLGMQDWSGLEDFLKIIRIIGFHRRLKEYDNLYDVSALIEIMDKFPKSKAVRGDFSKEIEKERKKKEKNERSSD